jgi:HAMP domain-containing protein
VAVWLGLAAILARNHDWGASSWFSAVSGLLVFLVALWLSRQQTLLQTALANLELREKIGVINGQADEIGEQGLHHRAIYFFGDVMASLALFDKADKKEQATYVTAVNTTLAQVKKHVFDQGLPADDKLYKLAQELRDMLRVQKIGRELEACEAGPTLLHTLSALLSER